MTKIQITKILTTAYLITAVASSFTHIMTLFVILGAERWESIIAALAIDVAAIIGKIATGNEFAAKARRAGTRALWIAGGFSLAANVSVGIYTGHIGSAIFGLIIVGGALWAEGMISKLAPKATRTAKVNKDGRTAEQIKRDAINAKRRQARADRKAAALAS